MSDRTPDGTMLQRTDNRRGRVWLYLLLNMNRLLLTAVLSTVMFVALVVLGLFAVPPFRYYLVQNDATRHIFQAFIGSLITGVTLVVTINQLVLSQEIGPLGNQRRRMSGSMSFRSDVEDIFGAVSPPEPAAFLRAFVENSRTKAETLQDTVTESDNAELNENLEQLVETIASNAEIVSSELEGRDFGEFEVVKAALDYNYAWKLHRARRFQQNFGEELDQEAMRTLIDLIDILAFFGPAREHIKTLYFQWELVNLSRRILYLSFSALVVVAALAAYLAPASFPGTFLGIDNLVWIVSAGITAGTTPFFLLTAYILRLATIAKRTLAIGPFILRSSESGDNIEWD